MSSPEVAGHGGGDAATEPAVPTAAEPGVSAAAEPGVSAAAERDAPGVGPGVPGAVAAADLSELDTLAGRPLAEHAEAYQRVHEQLQAALARLDGS